MEKKYLKYIKQDRHDKIDNHISCSYREYDEVMLYRIMRLSKLRTPAKRYHFENGQQFDMLYRDIHVGDFKFYQRRHNETKMRKFLHNDNIEKFLQLEKDSNWQTICERVSLFDPNIKKILSKLRKHVGAR